MSPRLYEYYARKNLIIPLYRTSFENYLHQIKFHFELAYGPNRSSRKPRYIECLIILFRAIDEIRERRAPNYP